MKIDKYFNTILIFSIICIISCSKGKDEPEPDVKPDIPAVKTVTLDKSTGIPGDVITLKSSFKLDRESWD